MNICPRQPAKDILLTAVHETLHAVVPSLREEIVEEFENELERLLNRMKIKVTFEP